MCRLALYIGPPILIADFVLKPSRSIIKQSYDARERMDDNSLPGHLRLGRVNADGAGVGWFTAASDCHSAVAKRDTTPCTFISVTPAWSNANLNRLASKIESGLIFAHVRAAYPGMPVSEQNCHPFVHGDYMFMHNGVVAGFLDIRRQLLAELSDQAYNAVQSFHSDSAVSFALFLNHLPSMTERQPPEALLLAMQAAIATIARVQADAGVTDTSLLNFVVSDGQTTVATRYVSDPDSPAASLYYAEGSAYEQEVLAPEAAAAAAAAGEADYHLTYGGTAARVCLVASEPVTGSASDWVEVPKNTALVVCREKDGLLTTIQAPLTSSGEHPRQAEVHRCMEAVVGAAGILSAGKKSQLRLSASNGALAALRVPVLLQAPPGAAAADSEDGVPDTPRVEPLSASRLSRRPSVQSLDASEGLGAGPSDAEHLLTGHRGPVMALATHGEMLFSGSTDCTVKVWCLRDCKYLTTLTGHRDPIRCLAVSGGALISAGAKTVRLWSLSDFSCLAVLAAADVRGSLKALAVGPDGSIYVGGQDCQVKMYPPEAACDVQADSPRCMAETDTVRTCTGTAVEPAAATPADNAHCAAVTCLALCGEYLASGSSDSTVRVWRAHTLEFVKALRGHRGSVLALHAVPGLLLSGGRDQLIRAWDADTLVCRRTLSGHTDDILAITSFEAPLTLQEPSIELPSPLTLPPHGCMAPAAPTPAAIAAMTPHLAALLDPGSPRSPFLPTLFATSSADGTVRVWSVKELSCLQVFAVRASAPGAPPPHVMACALTPSFATAALQNGNITLFPAEEVYAEAARAARRAVGRALHADAARQTGDDGPAAKKVRLAPGTAGAANGNGKQPEQEGTVVPSGTPAPEDPRRRLEREFERALRIFTRIKTVSSDPALSQDCFRGAKFLLRLLESLGAEVKLAQPVEGKNPVVLGRIGADPALPTVTCYGHYDVQPAMEPEWTSDPFELSAVDGYLIGRGVSDNKGPVLAFIYAVKELLEERSGGNVGNGTAAATAGLPCNVVFLIEGEEENGSIGFRDAVQQNLRWFEGTQAVLISNTLWVGERRPCITYGLRGMITASLEVRGAAKDLHSGNEGGVFSEPLADLTKILASLVDSRSNISIPGFYDGVRPNMLAAALERLRGSNEFSLEGYRAALGVRELTAGRSEHELLTARWCAPTLSVVDVRVGTAEDADTAHYRFGPTRFSVIPRAAVGKVSIRFVPAQRAETLIERLTAHVQHEFAKLRSGNSISVKVHSIGDWWEANPASELMRMAEGAVAAEWGETPLLVREGGTMPVASTLEKMLDAPALLLPMGQSSDCCHLANERIRRLNLMRGKNVIKRLLVEMGERGKGGVSGAAPPPQPLPALASVLARASGGAAQ